MLLTTVSHVDGYVVLEEMGLVSGIVVRSPAFWQGIMGSLVAIVGGKVPQYTSMCEQARRESFDIMIDKAHALGANAIIGVSVDTAHVTGDCVEVFCLGTAVKLKETVPGKL